MHPGSNHEQTQAEQHADGLASESIATAFLRLYYKFLIATPDEVHKFFKDDSVLTRGDDDEHTKSIVSHGQTNIRASVLSFSQEMKKAGLVHCHISKIDSQFTLNKAVLITVSGRMNSQDGENSFRFLEIFVLGQQPKGYYIVSDIFRWIDVPKFAIAEVVDDIHTAPAATVNAAANQYHSTANTISMPSQSAAQPSHESSSSYQSSDATTNGHASPQKAPQSFSASPQRAQQQPRASPAKSRNPEPRHTEARGAAAAAVSEPQQPHDPSHPPPKLSYAQMVGAAALPHNGGGLLSIPTNATPVHVGAIDSGDYNSDGEEQHGVATERINNQEDLDCQLFVRTFPLGTVEDDLRAAFAPFGEVKGTSIKRTQTGTYAFVTYFSAEDTARAAAAATSDGILIQGMTLSVERRTGRPSRTADRIRRGGAGGPGAYRGRPRTDGGGRRFDGDVRGRGPQGEYVPRGRGGHSGEWRAQAE